MNNKQKNENVCKILNYMNLLVLNIIKYHIHCQLQQCLNLHIIALCVGWLFLQIERFVNKYKRILPRVLGGPFPV